MTGCFKAVVSIMAVLLVTATVRAAEMPGMAPPPAPPLPAVRALRLIPPSLTLLNGRDERRVLVLGETESGKTIDLTASAVFKTDSKAIEVGSSGYVTGKVKGEAEVAVFAGNLQANLPVRVLSVEMPPMGFVRDVAPVLAKVGCNAGTCHGSAKGKEGFKLSLRGYDTEYDYQALINDLGGRRFNRVKPEESLMLLKPAGVVPHEGGKVLTPGTANYELIKRWIAEGTKPENATNRANSIEVLPANVYMDLPGMSQQMLVLAHYRDGSTRDVTREAIFSSSNIEVLAINDNSAVALRRGEGSALVRYEGNYATVPVICMGDRAEYAWTEQPQFNYIDRHVDAKLQAMKILPSGLCTDAEFARRVFLDLTGQPPTPEKVRAFLAEPSESLIKRARLIDELLAAWVSQASTAGLPLATAGQFI